MSVKPHRSSESGTDPFTDMISYIYQSAFEPGYLSQFLAKISTTLESRSAALYTMDPVHRDIIDISSHDIPSDGWEEYAQYYVKEDPRTDVALQDTNYGKVFTDYDIITEEEMRNNAFYEEFLKTRDFRYYAGVTLPIHAKKVAIFTIQRSPKDGCAAKRHIEFFEAISPHVQKAQQLSDKVNNIRQTTEFLEESMDFVKDAILLVSVDCELLYENDAGGVLLGCEKGLVRRRGRVEHVDPLVQKRWRAAIEHAVRLSCGAGTAAPAFLHLPLIDNTSCFAAVFPYHLRRINKPAALAIISNPCSSDRISLNGLQQLFGLTFREAEIVSLIGLGHDLPRIASVIGIGYETARSYLKQIYIKTGFSNQAELANFIGRVSYFHTFEGK